MASSRGGTASNTIKVKNEMDLLRKDRLPSFKSRDLTLGGLASVNMKTTNTASTKREFKPNLNVQRNKNADVRPVRDASGTRGRGGGRGERGRGVDRGKRGHNSHLVQTQGLFSEGAGALNVKRQINRSYSTRESSGSEILRKPTLNEIILKVDPEQERKYIRDILGDDDSDMEDDDKSSSDVGRSDKVMPISIDSYKIKQEDIKNLSSKLSDAHSETKSEESFSDFLKQQSSQLFLLNMPDTLSSATIPKDQDEQETESPEENGLFKKPPNNLCDLPEGQIGKLVRYKSGKLKLEIGNGNFYDVTHGIYCTFLQEVVSITTNREERSGNIVNLGKIKENLTVIPDYTSLLNAKKS